MGFLLIQNRKWCSNFCDFLKLHVLLGIQEYKWMSQSNKECTVIMRIWSLTQSIDIITYAHHCKTVESPNGFEMFANVHWWHWRVKWGTSDNWIKLFVMSVADPVAIFNPTTCNIVAIFLGTVLVSRRNTSQMALFTAQSITNENHGSKPLLASWGR